jgi:serine/threonine-protein kinase
MRAGRTIVAGRYELLAPLGSGGMAEVWSARHLALNAKVAIKFIHSASSDDVAQRRFLTEAQVTAQLNTRHAVRVFDFGVSEDGEPFLVMELLDGETLAQRLRRTTRLSPALTARFLGQAARALERAHALGIAHRDFKPDNLFIVRDDDGRDELKVMDFGVAKLHGDLQEGAAPTAPTAPAAALSATAPASAGPALTGEGARVGTPLYMAPEQVTAAKGVGPRSDIWAFGVVAYE